MTSPVTSILQTGMLFTGLLILCGCQAVPRRVASPYLISRAAPVGFPAGIRLITTDLDGYETLSPAFFDGIRHAAHGGSIDILALSGGGSGGAFGAGALAGLTQARNRPSYEMVTGVSTGALLAPFAFLGPAWDAQMHEAFTGKRAENLARSPVRTVLARLFSPRGRYSRSALFLLVDHYLTPTMVAAIATESGKGRRLLVATTDLDKHETVMWDLGAIARQRSDAARLLIRDVLVASASVPGIFSPVLVHVSDGINDYDEMHVDGGVTTSVFILPSAAEMRNGGLPDLRGANLYMVINGQLARSSRTTPFKTRDVLSSSLAAVMTYKAREAVSLNRAAALRMGMSFHLTEIPVDYPQESFIDFDSTHTQALFSYAERCARQALLWITPDQSLRRNMRPAGHSSIDATLCPAMPFEVASHDEPRTGARRKP